MDPILLIVGFILVGLACEAVKDILRHTCPHCHRAYWVLDWNKYHPCPYCYPE
jgi:hypothetical protein